MQYLYRNDAVFASDRAVAQVGAGGCGGRVLSWWFHVGAYLYQACFRIQKILYLLFNVQTRMSDMSSLMAREREPSDTLKVSLTRQARLHREADLVWLAASRRRRDKKTTTPNQNRAHTMAPFSGLLGP